MIANTATLFVNELNLRTHSTTSPSQSFTVYKYLSPHTRKLLTSTPLSAYQSNPVAMRSNPTPPHIRRPNSIQNQEVSTQADPMKPSPIPPHLRRASAAQNQEVLTKPTVVQSSPILPHQSHPSAAHTQEFSTNAEWVPPHMRKQRNDQSILVTLHIKPNFSQGSHVSNVETLAKENIRTETDTTEPVAQSARTDSTGSIEPQTPAVASTNVPTPHLQTGTKLVVATPQVDSEVKLAQTPSHKFPPHLRRGNMIQTPKSSADNRQIFNQSPISPPIPLSGNVNASQSSSDQMPVQRPEGLPSSMGDTASSGEPKWQENAVSSSNSPLSAAGSRATTNKLVSPTAITSPNPSSAGSPIHIFPFHLRKTQVSSSLVNSKDTVKEDCTKSHDNPGLHSRNEPVASQAGFAPIKLHPHLRRETSIPVESTELLAEPKGSMPLNAKAAASQENGPQPSSKEAKPHYIPPHLRGKKSNTQQSSDLNKSTVASIPNESTSGHSSNTVGGVPLGGNRKASTAAKTELEAVTTPLPQPGSGSAQLNVCHEEEYSNGFVQHTDVRPAKDVAPRVYSDASIKTHSAQKDGSDTSSEWADLRKPGPVKSLCISDDDFEDDASVKFIGAALAECPGDVIRLNSLNDNYFYTADSTGQEWHLDVTEEFLNAFVVVWRQKLPEEVIVVNVKAMEFMESFPINVNSFMDALEHPESFPSKFFCHISRLLLILSRSLYR